jgi:hypothetical protein
LSYNPFAVKRISFWQNRLPSTHDGSCPAGTCDASKVCSACSTNPDPQLTMTKGRKVHGGAHRDMPLRPTPGGLPGRAGPSFGLPLPGLSAPQWQRICCPSALAGGAGHANRCSEDLGPRGRQRPQSYLLLLPGVRLHRHIPSRRLARAHRCPDRRLRRSNFPAAEVLRL